MSNLPHDIPLAERIRLALGPLPGCEERHMFGGIAFLVSGHMCCGVIDDQLMLRLGEALAQAALVRADLEPIHARPMDFTGKPLKSMIYVDPEGLRTDEQLEAWVHMALAFVRTLPPKSSSPRPRRKA